MRKWKDNGGLVLETAEDAVEFFGIMSLKLYKDLINNAGKNWLPSQIEMLIRLMTSTVGSIEYAEVTQEDINEFMNLLKEVSENE